MKTNYYNSRKLSIYSLLGLLALLVSSCGSYQNKSYYDSDGIYGTESKKLVETDTNDGQPIAAQSNKYTEYFNSLRDDQQDEVFTDVERYSSYSDSTATQNKNQSAAWGSNPSNVTVNVYDNNWGWNNAAWNSWYGWGWNNWGWNNWGWNSWYGPNWGWGWNSWYGPNWGWGWNSWYGPGWGWNNWYGNGFYGNNHHNGFAFGNGRRGSSYGRSEGNSSRDYRRSSNIISRGTTITGARRTDYVPTRTSSTRSSIIRNSGSSPVRVYNNSNSTRNNSNNSTRTTTSPTRNSTYTPSNNSSNSTRSNTYSPSSSSSTRSSSSGGMRSGGGGGGSRSGGGGRR